MELFDDSFQDSEKGFTLVEVMVAITLLGVMMASVYQILDDSLETKYTVVSEDRQFTQMERALQRIQLDFLEIYSPLYYNHRQQSPRENQRFTAPRSSRENNNQPKAPKFVKSRKFPYATHNGIPIPKFESPDSNTFVFMTSSNRRKIKNTKESRYGWVRLGVDQMEKEPVEIRSAGGQRITRQFYSYDIYSKRHTWDDVKKQTLLNNVKDMSIEYWNPVRKEWNSNLEQLNDNRFRLQMIRVTVNWINPNGNEMTIERIFRHQWPHYDPKIDKAAYRKASGTSDSQDDEDNGQNRNRNRNRRERR